MASLPHPSGLNPLQRFRQACKILKTTSRASNPGWYQDALELDYQLHVRTDGANVMAFLHDKKKNLWAVAPSLSEKQLLDPAAMTTYADEALKHARTAGGKALGIVLHIADEFALTEINPGLTERGNLTELKSTLISDPASVLADSIRSDQSSWRLFPYFSPKSHSIATAATLSRRYESTLNALRTLGETSDFPVITCALSAPLVALLGMHGKVTHTEGHPFVAILQYPAFTVLAFFDANSELVLLRTQQHRGLRRPPNFQHTIATTLASLELDTPDIFVFPLGQDVDRTLRVELPSTFPTSHIQEVETPAMGVIPQWCPECLISTLPKKLHEEVPGTTLRVLQEEGWSLQDFLPATKEIAEIYPTKQEMTILRVIRIARVAAVLIGLFVAGYLILEIFKIRRTPEWAFEPSESTAINQRLAALNIERQQTEHWDALMEDRSKGWTTMESFVRLFPEDSGILIKSFDYSAKPDSQPGQARVGMAKEWKISGLVKQEAIDFLNKLNSRDGIASRFEEIAKATGSQAFLTNLPTRSLNVSVRTQENPNFGKGAPPVSAVMATPNLGETDYPFTFTLEIAQRFEATDPMAIISAKAP